MVGKRIKRVSHGYHYFFVRPKGNGNAHLAAERLMRIQNVKEVSITEGAYGFVVKAQDTSEPDKKAIEKISKVAGGETVKAACRCLYVRQ